MKKIGWLALMVLPLTCWQHANGQILRKLKEKAEQVVNNSMNKGSGDRGGTPSTEDRGGTGSRGKGGNNTGEGLVSTPPDVNASLADAAAAYQKNQYGDARFSVQQAMLGVEMMIGKEVLKGLPDKVDVLEKDTTSDRVTSTSWGWVGLTMERDYYEGGRESTKSNRKELDFMVANNSAWMAMLNGYFQGYAQSNSETQNWKQTRLKGYKAVIEFDKSSGYKISAPLGQTSILVLSGRNFATEQDFMNACNGFDLDKIKTQLGEK